MNREPGRATGARRTLLLLVLILAVVAVASSGTVAYRLYATALEQHRERLVDTADSWARLIGAVAKFDRQFSAPDDPAGAAELTLQQIREAHAQAAGFGETGEFTLARRNGEQIEFVLAHRYGGLADPEPVPFAAQRAEPMRRALGGRAGSMIGLDYRGVEVMAAYHPIPELNLGLVAKIDMVEVRAPFIRTGAVAGALCVALILAGALVFLRLGKPMVRQIEKCTGRISALVDSAVDGIMTIDSTGTIVSCNRGAGFIFGYSSEALVGQPLDMLLPEKFREEHRDRITQALADHEGAQRGKVVTVKGLREGGAEFDLEVTFAPFDDGDTRYLSVIIRDLSERRRWEEDLARLAAAVDQVGEAVLITELDGTIQYVNRAFERITGYSTAEAIGQTPQILKSGDHSDAFYQDLWESVSSGKEWSGRITNRRKNGSRYKATMTVSPMFDDAGRITNYVAVTRDVTEEMELEEQLRRAQKMEAVGQLAGGVAHDFNNLLTGISGYVQLSLSAPELDEQLETDLGKVLSLVGKAADLTSRLLLFSRREPFERKVLELDALVDESTKMLTRMIPEYIEMEVGTAAAGVRVHADPGQVEQVLMNLVVNARDALAAGGHLSVRTSEERVDAAAAATLGIAPGAYALLTVADDGHGMDAATLERIFEPFFTTKSRGKGTGLGLATVYGIVTEHGGAIAVDTRPGEGATFTVYLPVTDAELGVARKSAEAEPGAGAGETILLVEDEQEVRDVLQRQLSQNGYKVLAAAHPEHAERIYAEQGDEVALLLTDVVMPGYNGMTLYRHLAERDPDLKVLFMSGYADKPGELEELLKGDASFMRKPFQLEELTREVRTALDR